MKKLLKSLVLWMALCIGMVGCESNDCMLSSESYCSMSFVNEQGKGVQLLDTISVITNLNEYNKSYVYYNDTDTITSTTPIDSLLEKGYQQSVVTKRKQYVLLNQKPSAGKLELPLSYTAVRDTFFLRYSARLADTIWVEHQNLPYFSSMDCGTVMHYKLTEIASTHHLIDSIQIVNSEVTNTLKENVKIYYTLSY
jgi:hypothetical protein